MIQIRDPEVWDTNSTDEHQWWPRTMWLDPGKVSGVCILWFEPLRFLDPKVPVIRSIVAWEVYELHGPEDDQACAFYDRARELGGPSGLAVGIESFRVRQLNMDDDFLSPVRITSKIDHQFWKGLREWDGEVRRRPVLKQTPSDALGTITDNRLRLFGLYTPGREHRRDATRHAILHLRRLRASGGGAFRSLYGWEEGWAEEGLPVPHL